MSQAASERVGRLPLFSREITLLTATLQKVPFHRVGIGTYNPCGKEYSEPTRKCNTRVSSNEISQCIAQELDYLGWLF